MIVRRRRYSLQIIYYTAFAYLYLFPARRIAYVSNPCLLRLIRDQGILTINGTESLPIPSLTSSLSTSYFLIIVVILKVSLDS